MAVIFKNMPRRAGRRLTLLFSVILAGIPLSSPGWLGLIGTQRFEKLSCWVWWYTLVIPAVCEDCSSRSFWAKVTLL
jgi:hypothetical protein